MTKTMVQKISRNERSFQSNFLHAINNGTVIKIPIVSPNVMTRRVLKISFELKLWKYPNELRTTPRIIIEIKLDKKET
jgi:hypothetical protein